MNDPDAAARRALEFLGAIRNTPDLDPDVRRWSNTAARWSWLAGYLAAREDQGEESPCGNPFGSRSGEEESVPDPAPQGRTALVLMHAQMAKAEGKGYTLAHDQAHGPRNLILAGHAYTMSALDRQVRGIGNSGQHLWPFSGGWSPSPDPAVTLAKAAQLLLSAADVILAEQSVDAP